MSIYGNPVMLGGSGGGGYTIISKTITSNGTYNASSDNADGYSPVIVSVGADPALPSAYQEVEYLSVTGTEYVTVTIPDPQAILSIDFSQDAISSSEAGFLGYYSSSSNIAELYCKNGRMCVYSRTPNIDTAVFAISATTRYRLTYVFLTSGTRYNIGIYRSGRYPFTGKIYRFEAEAGSGAVPVTANRMLLLPCYRKADNEPGFYDVINNQFYTNQGTGSFGVGPVV